nr:MAG TPA: hypothetical protein [Caudoviricetes sp.]
MVSSSYCSFTSLMKHFVYSFYLILFGAIYLSLSALPPCWGAWCLCTLR